MDSDKRENPAMIRMWRIYRTAKEMCFDRVCD
jgi:DNA-directed RNA polymerase I, II, and III subunit RPABC1